MLDVLFFRVNVLYDVVCIALNCGCENYNVVLFCEVGYELFSIISDGVVPDDTIELEVKGKNLFVGCFVET